jgi:hypothetical protein
VTDDDPIASLADDIADGVPIDWTTRGSAVVASDPGLLRSFQVISSIGHTRREFAQRDRARGARALLLMSMTVVALAGGKLLVALSSAALGWSRTSPFNMQPAFAINLLFFGGAGIVLIVGGTRDRRVQALGVLYLIIGSAFINPLLPLAGKTPLMSMFAWARNVYPEGFLAFAWWCFVWLFPTEPKPPRVRSIGRAFLVLSAGFGLLLFVANAALALPLPGAIQPALQLFNRNAVTRVYWPGLFALAAPGMILLLWKSRVETLENRLRITWFVSSLVLGLSPILLAVMLTPFVSALRNPEWRTPIGIVLYVLLASIVPSTAYAVVVSHVMDVHLVVRRTMQYGLARSSVWCAIVAPLVFVAFDLHSHRMLTVEEYLTGGRPTAPLALSLLSLIVLTFRHQLLQRLDRWFRRDAADHSESLARLERGFRTSRTIRDVSTVLKRELSHGIQATSIAVLLVDERLGQLVSLEPDVPPLPRGSALLDLLRSVRTETPLSYRADGALARLLPPSDREWLDETRFGLFSPLVGSTGTLLGVVAIGEGRNGLPYTERDNMLIATMSGQGALKLENSRLKERVAGGTVSHDALSVDWENEPATRCPDCATMWPSATTHCGCGAPTVEAALPLIVNGKFCVDRFIGAGGAGVVYHAVDITLDRPVAIKTLPAIRLEQASRLHREARAMANVLHPNLALIYGAEHWKGTPLLIFEYLDGGTLLDSLRGGPLTIDETIDLGTLLADALDRVHASGVLHRDVKPGNIGYTSHGVPKLLDFGLAAILDRSRDLRTPPAVLPSDFSMIEELTWGLHPSASLTMTQQLIGTPLYLSPEALAGRDPEPSFDLWSLSMVLYEAAAGQHPFAGNTVVDVVKKVQRGPIPDIRDFRPDSPAAFAAFLNDSLSHVAARRPATAADLRARLRWLQRSRLAEAM